MGLGMCGDRAQLLIDFIEQGGDKLMESKDGALLPFSSGFPPSAPRTGQGAFTTSGAPIPAALRIFAFSMALGYESLVLSLRRSECPECLDPFPLYPAFPDSLGGRDAAEYYGSAAPPVALATCPPTLGREPRRFRRCSHSNFSVTCRCPSVILMTCEQAREAYPRR